MDNTEKQSLVAGLYGNALEWYDFLLFASFAPIFADRFFPSNVKYISLLVTFGVFAIGFIMRPIGGLLIGHYADVSGRRKALILSLCIMTIATACISFLPDYQHIGLVAPILFTLFRMFQGIAVGVELPGSATFLIEHSLKERKGLAGSLILSTAFLGIFCGSLMATFLSLTIEAQQLFLWGWRIAYLFGALLGIYGIILRINSKEPKAFEERQAEHEFPVKLVFTRYKSNLLYAIAITSILALGNYILIAYVTTFLVKTEGFTLKEALLVNLSALFFLTLLIPIMGYLSDRYSRQAILLLGLASLFAFSYPIFWLLTQQNWHLIFLSEILLCLCLAPLNAVVPTILTEIFPTAVRVSGASIGYNIGQAVFGGTLPLIALTLVNVTGSKLAPAWYLLLVSFIVLVSSIFYSSPNQQS